MKGTAAQPNNKRDQLNQRIRGDDMKPIRNLSVWLLSGMAALAMLSTASAAAPGAPGDKNVVVQFMSAADIMNARLNGSQQPAQLQSRQLSLAASGPPPLVAAQDFPHGPGLPVWVYNVNNSGRDGMTHFGSMVGTNPFTGKHTTRIPVVIVPMIITTHEVATSLDLKTFILSLAPGDVTQDSSAAQSTCLSPPNNVPSTLIQQSPIFQNAPFSFGGVFMGNTQYIDAFQRANFYQALHQDPDNYHVLFSPVRIAPPVTIDVPANEGLAIPAGSSVSALFGLCGTIQILDANWFDTLINDTLLPQLEATAGVNNATIPIFFLYNTDIASPVNNLNTCCVLGYHSFAGEPTPTQTYSVAEIDTSQLFPPAFENTTALSHELGELVNDPFTNNEVAPWGHVGQQGGCQENLEVGDPLSGTALAPVTMPNGFAYNLQEMAFFSWFIGGQSLGVNGWFSNNGTFTTDAGPACGVDLDSDGDGS